MNKGGYMKVRRFKSGLLVEGTKEEIDKIINAKPITNEFLEECKKASELFIKERKEKFKIKHNIND